MQLEKYFEEDYELFVLRALERIVNEAKRRGRLR